MRPRPALLRHPLRGVFGTASRASSKDDLLTRTPIPPELGRKQEGGSFAPQRGAALGHGSHLLTAPHTSSPLSAIYRQRQGLRTALGRWRRGLLFLSPRVLPGNFNSQEGVRIMARKSTFFSGADQNEGQRDPRGYRTTEARK